MIAVPVRYSSGFCSSSDWRLLRLTLAPTALSVIRWHGASEHPRIHKHSASCRQRRTPGELRRAETHRGSDESVNRSVAHSATFRAFSNSALGHYDETRIQRATGAAESALYSVEELFTLWLISGCEWEWYLAPGRRQLNLRRSSPS